MKRFITTTCHTCQSEVTIDLGSSSIDEAIDHLTTLDNSHMECPGFHVEFGGWAFRWNFLSVIQQAYDDQEKEASQSSIYAILSQDGKEFARTGSFIDSTESHIHTQVRDIMENILHEGSDAFDETLPFTVEFMNIVDKPVHSLVLTIDDLLLSRF